ncbi:hypothetical protein BU26DRAFT_534762 [Trematosphaeria pertusa]|uniref:FAR-17a/AIG1-like protein n=1 Tax=Trematosphaeria pertusa TaxID=390896 RepID=A0A6A6HXN6_9PLEO|nr:uncharacterized protein BU26DRAFT_534762 [Trematosphaeria pertusa]KAF2242787.1 hypothetical protein BU26DRAFT_534762 [Trematosphaeria pertusa]
MSASRVAEELSRRHPLQRLESPSKGFSGVVHNDSFGWHLQYLTILGISISTGCFICGLLADITSSHILFTLKNYLALVAAPIEIVISILYWGLRAIDETLVIPPDLPKPPLTADLNFHLWPSVLLCIDTLLLSPPWPTTPANPRASLLSLVTSTVIAFLYWFWIELCYSRNGFYPYPIFGLLDTKQRVGLFALSGVTMWAVGAGLRWVYVAVNGMEEERDAEGRKTKRKMTGKAE